MYPCQFITISFSPQKYIRKNSFLNTAKRLRYCFVYIGDFIAVFYSCEPNSDRKFQISYVKSTKYARFHCNPESSPLKNKKHGEFIHELEPRNEKNCPSATTIKTRSREDRQKERVLTWTLNNRKKM
jgi:hypothetical protein